MSEADIEADSTAVSLSAAVEALREIGLDADTIVRFVASIPDGLLVVDERGRIVVTNHHAEQMFGYESGELFGRQIEILVPPNLADSHIRLRERYASDPNVRSMGAGLELSGVRKDGTAVPIDIALSPVKTEQGKLVVAAVRNDTDRRRRDAELRRAHERLAMADDRERIARDLHDTVIQDVFGTALTLQSIATQVPPDVAKRIEEVVDRQDRIVHELRTAVFGLSGVRRASGSLRDDVLAIVNEATRVLGFRPAIFFVGPVETLSDDRLRVELCASLREALSNVARHARAHHVQVELEAGSGRVELVVTDDGVGPSTKVDGHRVGNGLENLRSRALALGGSCEIQPGEHGGTRLRWSVLLA